MKLSLLEKNQTPFSFITSSIKLKELLFNSKSKKNGPKPIFYIKPSSAKEK